MGHTSGKPTLSYVAALCIYGTIGWVLSFVNLPSEIVVLFRGVLGSLFIGAVLFATRRRFDFDAVKRNFGWLAVSGLCLGFNWVLLFAAYRATTVAIASLCNYMAPVILIIVAPMLLKEPRSIPKLACAAIAVLGMVFVSGVLDGNGGATAKGVALALGAALGFAAMVICNKKMGEVPVYEKAIIQLVFAVVAALPFVLVNNWGTPLHPDVLSVVLVLVLGIVHTGIAYCLYFGALGKLSAQSIAVLGYIEPAVSVLMSTLVMHQPLSMLGWIGALLIIGAAATSEVVK